MATRYYLPSTGAADVSPTYQAVWEKTSEADRLKMVTTKISSSFATKTCSENVATDPYDVLNRQYVSAPIGATSFTGASFKAQIRCMEDSAKMDALLYIVAYLVTNDGTYKSLLFTATSNELDDGELTNRAIFVPPVSPDPSQNGDRIVVEIGVNTTNTKTDLYTATMDFGDASGTDLPENGTETAQYNPWIECSVDIAAYVPPSGYVPKIIGPF